MSQFEQPSSKLFHHLSVPFPFHRYHPSLAFLNGEVVPEGHNRHFSRTVFVLLHLQRLRKRERNQRLFLVAKGEENIRWDCCPTGKFLNFHLPMLFYFMFCVLLKSGLIL